METQASAVAATIDVFLADDNVIVREGVRTLLEREHDLRVVGVAEDYDSLVEGVLATQPHVLVTDIRMPPTFQREGIEAAREVRQRCPGTGVVILSQYDDPEYAVSLVAEGSAGYGYLLKDHIAEGNQLVDAVRAVATGGTALDPSIVDALVRPVTTHGGLTPAEEALLGWVAEGKPIKAIAASQRTTPEAVDAQVEALFVTLAQGVSAGTEGAIRRLRLLHQCIVDREEQGESLSRLLPGGLAEKLRRDGRDIGKTEVVEVTVLMSDIRSYSTIAEHADPSQLAGQLNTHRAAMNRAILDQDGTIMQFVGDAVMAVFGAPFSQPDHAHRALLAAADAHRRQADVNADWEREGLPAFGLGIGLSTGQAAAALLGTEERLEYTLVGDTVNLSQRLQQLAESGETVLSQATMDAVAELVEATLLPEQLVKGRDTPVRAWRIARQVPVVAMAHPSVPAPVGPVPAVHGSTPPTRRRFPMSTVDVEQAAGPGSTDRPEDGTDRQDVLVVTGVRKTFEAENAPVRALRGANLRVPAGDFVALMGPSGCGKSTLLNLVAGLDVPDEGSISVGGELVTGRTEDELSLIRRRHIGIVFQFFNLLESMTALENVALPAIIAGTKRKPAESRARDLLDLLGVGDKAKSVPGSLSGGQRQRLAIARALANEPTLLLADEPTGALDSDSGHEIVELLSRLHRGGQTIVLVTHDNDVAQAAEHLIYMRDGQMVDVPERNPAVAGHEVR